MATIAHTTAPMEEEEKKEATEEAGSQADAGRLAEEAAVAIRIANSPGVNEKQLLTAHEIFGRLCRHSAAYRTALHLADLAQPAEVQHFGLKVLLHVLTVQASAFCERDREELKVWVITALSVQLKDGSPLLGAPSYIRAKYAEIIVEIARHDWPAKWPQLLPALLVRHKAPGAVRILLSIWKHLAELLSEDVASLVGCRRQELTTGLLALVEQPANAPLLITFMQQIMQQHLENHLVTKDALDVCRALVSAVPVEILLKHKLDDLLQFGFEHADLQMSAALAASSWIEKLQKFKRQHPGQDHCRFIRRLVKLAHGCKFQHDDRSYAFHCQVVQLLCDVCVCDVGGLCPVLSEAELTQMWSAFLHLLRYPSVNVQLDTLTAMCQLLRAHRGSAQTFLTELLNLIFMVLLRWDSMCSAELTGDREVWLLQCLGPASTSEPVFSISLWRLLLAETHAFHLRDGEAHAAERSRLFGDLKTKAVDLLGELCQVGRGSLAPAVFAELCQQAAGLARKALSFGTGTGQDGAWHAALDPALTLVERPGTMLLQRCEGRDERGRGSLVRSAMAFLKQVFAPAGELSGVIEQRQIEFLSHWAPMYRYVDANDLKEILRFLLASVEKTLRPEAQGLARSMELQRVAIDAIANLGKFGAVRHDQLEALHAECVRLSPRLLPPGRGKLCEALVAAIAACKVLGSERQSQLVNGIMEGVSASWLASELTKDGTRAFISRSFVAVMLASDGGSFDEPRMVVFRDARTLLQTFSGVIAKAAMAMHNKAAEGSAASHAKPSKGARGNRAAPSEGPTIDRDLSAACEDVPHAKLVSGVMRLWAPGIFKLARTMMSLGGEHAPDDVPLVALEQEALITLLRFPSKAEHQAMVGSKVVTTSDEWLPASLEKKRIEAVRNILWELRLSLAKAAKLCMALPDFWMIAEAGQWLASLAGSLPTLRPHVAQLILREVYAPLFGYRGACSGGGLAAIPGASRLSVCNAVLPRLVDSAAQLARGSSAFAAVPDELHVAWVTAVASVSHAAGFLLAALAGSGSPQAGLIAHPVRNADGSRLFRSADPSQAHHSQERPNKKRRKGQAGDQDMAHSEEEIYVEAPPGAAAFAMRDAELRSALREALVGMLKVPDRELAQTALTGLAVWTTQTWNCLARGEGDVEERGNLLHVANDELLEFSEGVLKPVIRFMMAPPGHVSESSDGTSYISSATVQQHWTQFVTAVSVNGQPGPSALVREATHVFFAVFSILVWLFRITCRKANLKIGLEQVYLCPPLFEAMSVCRQGLKVTEDDTKALVEVFLQGGMSQDAQRSALREKLHKACMKASASALR